MTKKVKEAEPEKYRTTFSGDILFKGPRGIKVNAKNLEEERGIDVEFRKISRRARKTEEPAIKKENLKGLRNRSLENAQS